MKAKLIKEFEKGLEPADAMGTTEGKYWVYDIKQDPDYPDEDDAFTYSYKSKPITEYVREFIPEISDNEMDRFMAFTFRDIMNKIPIRYFQEQNYKEITEYVKNGIRREAPHWMGMHSDRAMRRGMRW